MVGLGLAGGHLGGPAPVAAVSPAPIVAAAPSAAPRPAPVEVAAANLRSARLVGRVHGTPLKLADRVDRFTIDDTALGFRQHPLANLHAGPYAR